MGNNYYLSVNGKSYHLGKSSGGWKFALNIINILKAIIDNLKIENMETVKEVSKIINFSAYLKYDKSELVINNISEDIVIMLNNHKWFLDYTDIFKCTNNKKTFVYVNINISVITKKELKSWVRKLLEIEGAFISDEERRKCSIDDFINLIESKKGLDLISHASLKKENEHWRPLSVEYKIGNLRCSAHSVFC